ncbi:hypothetical protein PI124_g21841 [Phytophthora idaei]|nr:hypothetical protein PI125_g26970 [Phytophthora idaei]KAG3064284.1 hypothetical protein PI125_g24217 [Phytophthora idaei]KAG3079412.1 hypothetical protein PI125_g20710 [Phytophthora idaei]KAG3120105.1 hypothetical protein PI126_g24516 [Phytophthora idaei]KAG3126570.1 hypothetical protein PI126_g22262 [Phytophthora idaei]
MGFVAVTGESLKSSGTISSLCLSANGFEKKL